MNPPAPLRWRNVQAVPLIHGRLPFALWVREHMLGRRVAAVAVELPASLRSVVLEGVRRLPEVHVAVYRESAFDAPQDWRPWQPGADSGEEEDDDEGAPAWFVPLDPCDGIIEALRIADRERAAVHFVDAEVEQFAGRSLALPDPQALLGLGLERWYATVREHLGGRHRATPEDLVRESHMAARLLELSRRVEGEILFVCGMAHWERVRERLESGRGQLFPGEGPDPQWVRLVPAGARSMFAVLGELPFVAERWERHRSSIALERYDPIHTLKEMLLEARILYESSGERRLETATPAKLANILDYVRRLTVRHHRLTPDLYSLVVAAKGVVGNDFALALLEIAGRYGPNSAHAHPEDETPFSGRRGGASADGKGPRDAGEGPEASAPGESPGLDLPDRAADPESGAEAASAPAGAQEWFDWGGEEGGILDGRLSRVVSRTPGEPRQMRRVQLVGLPPDADRERWKSAWNPHYHCSWPPEDVVIENLRSYVSSRALQLAGIDQVRTEEFQASLKDGLDLRQTLRDLPRGKLHVRIEPRVPGRVGAVVIVFEEDDSGERYPWRSTWLAEHAEESTLAFYATDYSRDMIGPGIARARYGGCMMIFPPIGIPDVWEDLRFERARRPSERLLLAAGFWSSERFVCHVSAQPPSDDARATLAAMGKHVVHLPLSSFSARTMEKIRTVHVLNHQQVRSWAGRYIR